MSIGSLAVCRGSPRIGGHLSGVRVLVVDDDAPGLTLAESVLGRFTSNVMLARDGHEGVVAFRIHKVDIVLMDHRMPSLSGLEATIEIRRIETELGWRRTPIIALTACAYPLEVDEFLQAGADDVLTKPYRIEQLVAMIEKWSPRE